MHTGSGRAAIGRSALLLSTIGLTALWSVAAWSAETTFLPFGKFFVAEKSDVYSNYRAKRNVKVASAAAFQEMRDHLEFMYAGTTVLHSFVGRDDHHVDCIPIRQQPGLRRTTMEDHKVQLKPPTLPAELATSAGKTLNKPNMAVVTLQKGDKDKFGNERFCREGTIPMRRITLRDMTKFETLQKYFMAGPGKFYAATAVPHRYAHAYQSVNNLGGAHRLNLWSPTPTTNNFSLSQHWYVGGSGGNLQTVEGGWQNYPYFYGTNRSHLFIFYTPDGYSSGCYNLRCAAFVQVSNVWNPGGAWSPDNYSVSGGQQREYKMIWYRDPATGNWWLFCEGASPQIAVGYYPKSLYGSGQLSKYATQIDYGGEVTGTSSGQMGSGAFANRGWSYAAFQRRIYYFPTSGSSAWANLTASQPTPSCYTIDLHNIYGSWGTYFYFGGPSCATAVSVAKIASPK
jgi:hypothetical protein